MITVIIKNTFTKKSTPLPVIKYTPTSGQGNVWRAARAKMHKRGNTWYYQVIDFNGNAVLMDNSNNYNRLLKQAREDVAVVRRIDGAGHKLAKYSEVNPWY